MASLTYVKGSIDSDISLITENTLTVYRWNGSSWVALADSVVDVDLNKVTATSQQFSNYALLGNALPFCGDSSCNGSETCSNCPTDVGKCDGESCNSKSECEGNYCVHNKCSHTPYIKGDTYCDSSVGENCLNSLPDCACSASERCNSQGKCETYCGNGICESKEQGICKSDCQWCGDGTCDPNKETCKGCPSDCGECEKTEEEQQFTQQLLEIKEGAEGSAQRTKENKVIINITIGSTLGLIILLVIVYLIYKKIEDKKSHEEEKSTYESKNKCPKCNANIDDKSKFCKECGHKLK